MQLEVENLNVSFHSRDGINEAVKGISFNLEKGKVLAIVGESGSGKRDLDGPNEIVAAKAAMPGLRIGSSQWEKPAGFAGKGRGVRGKEMLIFSKSHRLH